MVSARSCPRVGWGPKGNCLRSLPSWGSVLGPLRKGPLKHRSLGGFFLRKGPTTSSIGEAPEAIPFGHPARCGARFFPPVCPLAGDGGHKGSKAEKGDGGAQGEKSDTEDLIVVTVSTADLQCATKAAD